MSESKNKQINYAQIHWSDQSEPISTLFDDVYFNTEEGIEESFYVFFQGNELNERWIECKSEHFSIAETGFGTGLNFLVTCLQFQLFLKSHPKNPLKRLFFSSFEKYPLNKQDLTNALQRWPTLKTYIKPLIEQYPLALRGCHRILFEQFNITLDLWFGDVQQTLPTLYHPRIGIFDCWYLDGFAPSKNPDMWSNELFKLIAESCKKNATIATFTAAGFVRRGLIEVGFTMGKKKGYGKKREMLIGQLEEKLTSQATPIENLREAAQENTKDIAVIGSGITSACLALALTKRGYKVSLYCQDATLTEDLTETEQTALYPLLTGQDNTLDQFFANSFLYARNHIKLINQFSPLNFEFSGLELPNSNQAENKFLATPLPIELLEPIKNQPSSWYCKLGGEINLKQFIETIIKKTSRTGELDIKFNKHLDCYHNDLNGWQLQFSDQIINHPLVILTTAPNNLPLKPITLPYAGALVNTTQTEKISFYKNIFLLTRLTRHELCTAPLLSEMLASQINKEPLPFTNEILTALQSIKV